MENYFPGPSMRVVRYLVLIDDCIVESVDDYQSAFEGYVLAKRAGIGKKISLAPVALEWENPLYGPGTIPTFP